MNNKITDDIDLCRWVAEELPIRFIGDEILLKRCEPFSAEEFKDKEIKDLAKDLISTLKKYREKAGTGRGLAANQIGISRRIIAVWLGQEPEIMVNPEIISTQGEGSYWESCISSGALIIGEVIRPWQGVFKYQDLEGQIHTIEADEKQTRLLLHEIDQMSHMIR